MARRCPYCGHPVASASGPDGSNGPSGPSGPASLPGSGGSATGSPVMGRFVGPVEPQPSRRLSPWEWLRRLAAFVVDPRVPAWKKGLLAAGIVYLLMPLDLAPDLLPGLGWLDDVLVAWWGLRALARELARYGAPRGGRMVP